MASVNRIICIGSLGSSTAEPGGRFRAAYEEYLDAVRAAYWGAPTYAAAEPSQGALAVRTLRERFRKLRTALQQLRRNSAGINACFRRNGGGAPHPATDLAAFFNVRKLDSRNQP